MDWLSLGREPSGGAAGMFYMGRQQNEQARWDLEQALKQLEAEKNRMENERIRRTAEDLIASTNATNRATARTIGRQKEAMTSQEEDKAYLSRGSREATLRDTLGKYQSAEYQRKAENLNRAAEVLGAVEESIVDSPNWQADLDRLSKQYGVPPQIHEMLKRSRDSKELRARIQVLKDNAVNSLAHTRKMQEATLKEEGDYRRADLVSGRQLEGVKYTADKGYEGKELTSASKAKLEELKHRAAALEKEITQLEEKNVTTGLTDKERAMLNLRLQQWNRVHQAIQAERSAGAPVYPFMNDPNLGYGRPAPQSIPGVGGTTSTPRQYDAQGNRIK